MSSKCDDSETVPLAPWLHDILDRRAKFSDGSWGREAIEGRFHIDLGANATRIYAEWLQRKGKKAA